MTNWKTIPLKKITTKIGSGATPRGGKEAYKENGVTLIRSLNVYDFNFDYSGLAFIDQKQADGLSNVVVEPEDVLLNITGASVARCCIVPKEILPARVNQHVAIIRINKDKANPYFVFYVLVSPTYKHHLLSLAQGGATREALTKSTIEDFEIPLPSLETQRRIAHVLSAYDDLIENNTRRIKTLEQVAHDLYREWFVEFRFPGHEDVPLIDSKLGQIPQGWEVGGFGDIAKQKRDNVHPNDVPAETPYVGLAHIPQYSLALMNWGRADETRSSKIRFNKGDVIFAKIRPYLHKVVVAPLSGVASSDSIIIIPKENVLFGFVVICASSQDFVAHTNVGTKGTQMPRADWDFMADYQLTLAPNHVLQQFNEIVLSIIDNIQNMVFRNKVLREARDLLLPRLVSGHLDVSDVELPKGADE